MSAPKNTFSIDLSGLKKSPKPQSTTGTQEIDKIAATHGFVDREPKKRRGRPPSPRTGQVRAHVMPDVSVEISEEARLRGVTQGVLIEEAWALYKSHKEGSK